MEKGEQMNPHLLKISPAIKARPPAFWLTAVKWKRRFLYSARMVLPKRGEQPQSVSRHMTNIVNNFRVTNRLLLRITLPPKRSPSVCGVWPGGTAKAVTDFADEAINQALRRELDRQLQLMARGENIAANQRRKKMMGNYLLTRPSPEQRLFYTAPMRFLWQGGEAQEPFQDDIMTERRTSVTRRTTEFQEERELPQGENMRPEVLRQIANQVFSRVERKIRLNSERMGILR